ncbi:hypothetical protein SGRA_3655 [Saprospira grandis str. Lewin]|uniref:Uncharacterized protein n=1 Tax=Saprospira grandis (strain Lewin) TaxID=984262 RepID=H6L6U6_SAPGL|nr:hypothetical protein SGRA_3655 [Saprospira grandis str. Lewin]
MIWGLRLATLVGVTLWGSQVCSALRFFATLKKLGLACGHPAASLGRSTAVFFLNSNFTAANSNFFVGPLPL